MINFSTATTRLHKLAHAAWAGPPQAMLTEMQRIKEHMFESIDPLFRAESRFAERLNELKPDRPEARRDDAA